MAGEEEGRYGSGVRTCGHHFSLHHLAWLSYTFGRPRRCFGMFMDRIKSHHHMQGKSSYVRYHTLAVDQTDRRATPVTPIGYNGFISVQQHP